MESMLSLFYVYEALLALRTPFSKLLPPKCWPVASWPEDLVSAVARGESLIFFVAERRNLVTAQSCPSLPLNDDPVGGEITSHMQVLARQMKRMHCKCNGGSGCERKVMVLLTCTKLKWKQNEISPRHDSSTCYDFCPRWPNSVLLSYSICLGWLW